MHFNTGKGRTQQTVQKLWTMPDGTGERVEGHSGQPVHVAIVGSKFVDLAEWLFEENSF